MPRRSRALLAVGLAFGLTLLSACGSPPPDPRTLLNDAKASVDNAKSVHFDLSSSNAQGSGTLLVGGNGDAARPDGFRGQLALSASGIVIHVQIASVAGKFYVELPFTTNWQLAKPDQYGFGDPAQLLNTTRGLTSLIAEAKSPTLGSQDRYQGELLDEVTCSLPGADVARLLTSAAPATDDQATIGIDDATHQLRRVVLSGPFFSATQNSTFTLILDNYGENVTVTAPPVSASPSPSPG